LLVIKPPKRKQVPPPSRCTSSPFAPPFRTNPLSFILFPPTSIAPSSTSPPSTHSPRSSTILLVPATRTNASTHFRSTSLRQSRHSPSVSTPGRPPALPKRRRRTRKSLKLLKLKGKSAAFLEDNADDVWTTSIGNVPAGAVVAIVLKIVHELKTKTETGTDDAVKLVVPIVIAPRYGIPPEEVNLEGARRQLASCSLPIEMQENGRLWLWTWVWLVISSHSEAPVTPSWLNRRTP